MSETVSLRSLLVPSKAVEVDFPGFDGFKLNLSFMSRDTLISIRKRQPRLPLRADKQPMNLMISYSLSCIQKQLLRDGQDLNSFI